LCVVLGATACSDAGTAGPTVDATATLPFPPVTSSLSALPVGYRVTTVLDGLRFPTSIAALPDGRLLVAEHTTGQVRVVRDGVLQPEPWAEFPVYFAEGKFVQELGLAGVAVDPKFTENRYVYVYYSQRDLGQGRRTVFARLTDVEGRGTDQKNLLEVPLAPEGSHIAGAIAFQGDAILLGVGDHEHADLPRDATSIAGKILRIDRDGKALPDNPLVSQQGAEPRIYASGVRNPFGIALDSVAGTAYFTDNRNIVGDAVYALEAGADYGWPEYEHALRQPIVMYDEPKGVAGIVAYRGEALPEFDGDLLYCSYHGGGQLHWIDPEATGLDVFTGDRVIAGGCSSGLTVAQDGTVYFLSYEDGKLAALSR
jgi:glucose/arabinose dehydrogenase